MSARRDQLQIRIEGFAPDGLTRAELLIFWQGVSVIALEVKDRELAEGLDFEGKKLVPIKESTRKHRVSEMGKASADAPPLMPAFELSRTRAWLRASSDESGVTIYWAGRSGKYAWRTILGFHARIDGYVRGAPVRNVFGISPKGYEEIRIRSLNWWVSSGRVRPGGVTIDTRLSPQPAGRKPGYPQKTVRGPSGSMTGFETIESSGPITYHTRNAPAGLPGTKSTGWGQFRTSATGKAANLLQPRRPSPIPAPKAPKAAASPPTPKPATRPATRPQYPAHVEQLLAKIPAKVSTDQTGKALIDRVADVWEGLGYAVDREHYETFSRDRGYLDPARLPIAAIRPSTQEYFINQLHPLWEDPDKRAKAYYDRKIFSTPSRDGTAYHEIGHQLHAENLGYPAFRASRQWDTPAQAAIAQRVSQYAASEPVEFVAETYAGIMTGIEYDPEILALYDLLGGVRPW